MAEHFTLTELQYSDDLRGTLRIYVYNDAGTAYLARQYFARRIRYPGEEVLVERAKAMFDAAMIGRNEIRITNSGDQLVLHARDGKILHPADAEQFWRAAAK